jgi:signal transduction histidine kinase
MDSRTASGASRVSFEAREYWGCAAADALAAGVLVCSQSGDIRFANRWAERLTELPESRLRQMNLAAVFGPSPLLPEPLAWLPPGEEQVVHAHLVTGGVERQVVVRLSRHDSPLEPGLYVALFREAETPDDGGERGSGDWQAALQRVVAGFAHATRNPLAAISGLVDLWADGVSEDHPDLPIVRRVRGQVTRLEKLVRSFASFDRIPTRIESRPLPDLLVAAQALLRRDDIVLPLDPETLRDAATLSASMDLDCAATVIAELWRNATEALPAPKPPTLRVRSAEHASSRLREIRIEVADSGPGVPASLSSRIFEPFFTTRGHRLGIGLTVCRAYAGRMGGRISVRAVPGQGTVIALVLPEARP